MYVDKTKRVVRSQSRVRGLPEQNVKTVPIWYRMVIFAAVLSLGASLLVGCGGGGKTDAEPQPTTATAPTGVPAQPTSTPTQAPRATEAPASPTAAPTSPAASDDITKFESLISNVEKLAPLRIISTNSTRYENNDPTVTEFRSDVDADGNQYMIFQERTNVLELYIVDGEMYVRYGNGDTPFVAGAFGQGANAWDMVTALGGQYLLAFDSIEKAELLGSERVNGFNTNKYAFETSMELLDPLGLSTQQGNTLEFNGFVWIEMNAVAMVKSELAFRVTSSTGDNIQEIISTFDAEKVDIPRMQKPENVVRQ